LKAKLRVLALRREIQQKELLMQQLQKATIEYERYWEQKYSTQEFKAIEDAERRVSRRLLQMIAAFDA